MVFAKLNLVIFKLMITVMDLSIYMIRLGEWICGFETKMAIMNNVI